VGSVEDATVAALEGRAEVLTSEGEAVLENVSGLQVRLRQRKAQLKEVSDAGNERNLEIAQFENEIEIEIDDLRSQNASLQAEVTKFTESDPELRTAVTKQGELIRMNQADHERINIALSQHRAIMTQFFPISHRAKLFPQIQAQSPSERQDGSWLSPIAL
jgi:chromosome segregation ATPase